MRCFTTDRSDFRDRGNVMTTGDVDIAYGFFRAIMDHDEGDSFHHIEPNASSYEMMISLLAQSLRVNDALEVVQYMLSRDRAGISHSVSAGGQGLALVNNPSIYLSLTTAAVLLGETSKARDWISLCKKEILSNDNVKLKESMKMKFLRSMQDDADNLYHDDGQNVSKSMSLFLSHR